MKKDVWLTITSSQRFDGCPEERIDLMTAAKLYRQNGKYFIQYEESELTGLDGTRTTIKLDDNTVTLIRTGKHPAHMMFTQSERQFGLYHQPVFGNDMTISTYTQRVYNTIGETGGALSLDYTIELNNEITGKHHFEMYVTTKPMDPVQ